MLVATYGGVELDLDSVLLDALATGVWAEERGPIVRGASAVQAGVEVSTPEMRAAEEAFRRERGLLAADDLTSWLAARMLTVADLRAHLRRSLAASRHDGAPVGDGLGDAARTAVLLAPWAAQGAERLLRGAAAEGLLDEPPPAVTNDDAAALAARGVEDEALPLTVRDPARLEPCAAAVLRLQAALTAAREGLDDRDVEETLSHHRIDWTVLEFDELVLETEPAAREAILCVNEDGLEPAAVGELAGARLESRVRRVEELGAASVGHLLAGEPGSAFGPVRREDGWSVLVLRRRVAPASDLGEAWERAREVTLRTLLERRLAGRVKWHVEL